MLTPEAERVWSFLRESPLLSGFVLVGGSALSERIDHRLSRDLDLAFPAEKLPVDRLSALQTAARAAAVKLDPDDDEAALHDFHDGGLDLRDYQQDFIADGIVRVSFFAAEPPLISALKSFPDSKTARMAELSELFASKCLVCARRSKTRDWHDIHVLMRGHGFTLNDMRGVFERAGIPNQMDMALSRLCSGATPAHDEGIEPLSSDVPSVAEMAAYFRKKRDEYETGAAGAARSNGRA